MKVFDFFFRIFETLVIIFAFSASALEFMRRLDEAGQQGEKRTWAELKRKEQEGTDARQDK